MSDLSQLGFNDSLIGAEIFSLLKIDRDKLTQSSSLRKISDIANFFNRHPDAVFTANKVMRRLRVGEDRLDHLWSYVDLHRQKGFAVKEREETEENIKFKRWADDSEKKKMMDQFSEAQLKEDSLTKEISLYEK